MSKLNRQISGHDLLKFKSKNTTVVLMIKTKSIQGQLSSFHYLDRWTTSSIRLKKSSNSSSKVMIVPLVVKVLPMNIKAKSLIRTIRKFLRLNRVKKNCYQKWNLLILGLPRYRTLPLRFLLSTERQPISIFKQGCGVH